jgi:hypothetical protein
VHEHYALAIKITALMFKQRLYAHVAPLDPPEPCKLLPEYRLNNPPGPAIKAMRFNSRRRIDDLSALIATSLTRSIMPLLM